MNHRANTAKNEEIILGNTVSIKQRFYGYDRAEVDRRLKKLSDIIVDTKEILRMQEDTIKILEEQVNDYRSSQSMMRAFFINAENKAKEIIEQAEERAHSIGEGARGLEEQAATLLADAETEARDIRAEADRYFEQKREETERQIKDAMRVTSFAENFEEMMRSPKMESMTGQLLGKHIFMFLKELSNATKEAVAEEIGREKHLLAHPALREELSG